MPDPRAFECDANGLRLRALEWPGDAPLVLLFHATSFCADVWRPVWEAARASGAASLRALAVDQRGHGRSAAPADASAYAWTRLAGDLIALAKAESGEDGVVLVGHSSGGTAALAAAGLMPERVRAVVVVEPVLFDPPAPGADVDSFAGSRLLATRARKRRTDFESREAARAALRERFPYKGFDAEALEACLTGGLAEQANGSVSLRCAPRVEAWAYEGAAALDVWPRVAKIRVPVLVLVAEHSAIPPALLERLCASAADTRVEKIASATHFAALEQPRAVGRALGAFLAERSGR
jgi:pimeloyl-ACP methyl ester carboxylesterase